MSFNQLPVELIQTIGETLQCSSPLGSLASTNWSLRNALLPSLYREVEISSYRRLEGAISLSPIVLGYIRHLIFHIDWDFFHDWMELKSESVALLTSSILMYSHGLRSLVIRLDDTPFETPWNRIGCLPAWSGLPLNLNFAAISKLNSLKHLELHAISLQHLPALLNLTQNLETLLIVSSGSLRRKDTTYLLEGLQSVRSLTSISINLDGWSCTSTSPQPPAALEILPRIGVLLPYLTNLDLRISGYDFLEGSFNLQAIPANNITSMGIASHLKECFPALQSLRLPFGVNGGDEEVTSLSRDIIDSLPHLREISWVKAVFYDCYKQTKNYAIIHGVQPSHPSTASFRLLAIPVPEKAHAMKRLGRAGPPGHPKPQSSITTLSGSSLWSYFLSPFRVFSSFSVFDLTRLIMLTYNLNHC